MDFERLGLYVGARRDAERRDEWGEHVAGLQAALQESEAKVAPLRRRLGILRAHAAGLEYKRKMLLLFLGIADRGSPLLRETGWMLSNGETERQSSLLNEKAFDAKAKQIGLATPEKFRRRRVQKFSTGVF